ncbi:MAG: penicillin acylase family protein [Ardenticatenales bacterium]|nr:penicillin acylase family protein [Ardenticatenales bacterium]
MRLFGRAFAGFVFALAVAAAGASLWFRRSLPQTSGMLQVAGLDGAVEIVRDAWGVPHIYATTDHDAHLALGYVHAQDRLWQMEWQRRIGAGRLSEVVGIEAVATDKFLRTLGVRRAAEAVMAELSPDALGALEAYAAGVNALLAENRALPPEFIALGVEPEPWTVPDSLVWMKMMSWNLAGNYDLELLRTRLIQAVGVEGANALMPGAPPGPDAVGAARSVGASRIDALLTLNRAIDGRVGQRGPDIGSNGWVVAGKHTATGEPILANDPHLGAQIPSQWYLAEMNGDRLHVTGATLPGLPLVVIGRNARVAWGLTNLGADVQDLYVERVKPDDRNSVAVNDGWAPMTVVDAPIRVKDRPDPVPWTARSTRHGPVLSDVIDERAAADVTGGEDTVLALRWTALDPGDTTVDAFLALNHAANWDDFTSAMRRVVSPCQNVLYADVDGHIGHIAPCRIPIRAAGDGTLPVPGWNDSHAWTADIPFDELPQTKDPERGYIVTANQRIVPDDYPHWITRNWAQPYRAQRITSLLQGLLDSAAPNRGAPDSAAQLKAIDMIPIQGDQTSLYVQAILPRLRAIDPAGDERRGAALDMLAKWDGRLDQNSAAAALVEAWLHHLGRLILLDDLPGPLLNDYLPNDNLQQQPRRFLADALAADDSPWCDDTRTAANETCDDLARRALDGAIGDLDERLGGRMSAWRWGRVHQARYLHQPFGEVTLLRRIFNRRIANGGDAFTVNAAPSNPAEPYQQEKAPGYRQIVTLREEDVGRFSIATGQSGHPLSGHYADRLRPHRDVEYVPMTIGRGNVSGNVLRLEPASPGAAPPTGAPTTTAAP